MSDTAFDGDLYRIHSTRGEVLATCVMALLGASLYFLKGFPFHRGFCVIGLISFALHLSIALLYEKMSHLAWNLVMLANIVLLGAAIHFTGGILSPFNALLAATFIFLTGVGRGRLFWVVLGTAVASYVSVILLEFSGVLTPIDVYPAMVYRSWPVTLMVAAIMVCYVLTASMSYRTTVAHLRRLVRDEFKQKEVLTGTLARLDARADVGLAMAKLVHDVRGPLGAVSNLVGCVAQDEGITGESREDCRVAQEELARLSRLTGRILKHVRPGSGQREILELGPLLESVAGVLGFMPGAAYVEVKMDLPPGELRVKADKDELQQAYFNLLKNAAEALDGRQDGGVIEVSAREEDGAVRVDVLDNGEGVESEDPERRVFPSAKSEGTGLGLRIVSGILAAYGGGMSVESRQGGGTAVRTWLPLADGGGIEPRNGD